MTDRDIVTQPIQVSAQQKPRQRFLLSIEGLSSAPAVIHGRFGAKLAISIKAKHACLTLE